MKRAKMLLLGSDSHKEEMKKEGTPKMILHYNDTKARVDTIDQMKEKYSVQRATFRWTMAQFMYYLDIAATNASVIHTEVEKAKNQSFKMEKRKFLWLL